MFADKGHLAESFPTKSIHGFWRLSTALWLVVHQQVTIRGISSRVEAIPFLIDRPPQNALRYRALCICHRRSESSCSYNLSVVSDEVTTDARTTEHLFCSGLCREEMREKRDLSQKNGRGAGRYDSAFRGALKLVPTVHAGHTCQFRVEKRVRTCIVCAPRAESGPPGSRRLECSALHSCWLSGGCELALFSFVMCTRPGQSNVESCHVPPRPGPARVRDVAGPAPEYRKSPGSSPPLPPPPTNTSDAAKKPLLLLSSRPSSILSRIHISSGQFRDTPLKFPLSRTLISTAQHCEALAGCHKSSPPPVTDLPSPDLTPNHHPRVITSKQRMPVLASLYR
nr:hypothetical protein CFP56_63510 [Quercus suber]